MSGEARVVIIGAGIQGLSCAFHLTVLGIKDVQVLEKDGVGQGASSRSASMLMLQREDEVKNALSIYSYLRYLRLNEEWGIDPKIKRIGFLSVVNEREVKRSLERARIRRAMGIPTDVLTPSEIREIDSTINISDINFGVYGPDDSFIDVPAVLAGLESRIKGNGGKVRTQLRATGIVVESDRVIGVKTDAGETIGCDVVVNAAGAAAAEVASWVGVTLRFRNCRRTIFILPRPVGFPTWGPMIEDAEDECYYRHYGDNVLFGLGKEEDQEPAGDATGMAWDDARKFASHRFPPLSDVNPVDRWSGIRSLTSDGRPILGTVEGIAGFVVSCGWGGEGIQHAPAGGQLVAEVVAFGGARSFDVAQLSPNRPEVM